MPRLVLLAAATAACDGSGRDPARARGAASAAPEPARYDLGRMPSGTRLAALDIDVNPAGVGLPPGRGTVAEGATVYGRQCASCHGARGEGIAPYPRLVGAEPRDSFPFGRDLGVVKTVGNYWPYATTLYDYIHRAMPHGAPGSLQPREVYAVTAFLLAENGVVPRDFVADAATLPRVVMPARQRFVPDDRKGGGTFR